MQPSHLHPPRRAALLFVAFSCVWAACGKTNRSESTDSATGGNGASGGSGSGGGTSVGSGTSFGGAVSTGDAITTSSVTTGFTSTSTVGGSGGQPACGGAEQKLEGCYRVYQSSGGGGGGAPPIDACWDDAAPENCETTFEGEVVYAGNADEVRCGVPLFGGLTELSEEGRLWLELRSEQGEMHLIIGRPTGALDVEVGDTVAVNLLRQTYHFTSVWGTRLTLTKDGELLAVLNDNLPIEEPTKFGDLTLSRGPEVCERAEDDFSCGYVAHDLEVLLDDEGLGVSPDSRARLGPYEILTDENFHLRDGGGCDSGDVSDFLIARVKPRTQR